MGTLTVGWGRPDITSMIFPSQLVEGSWYHDQISHSRLRARWIPLSQKQGHDT